MNKVILIGRLTKDPEIRYTQGAQAMAVARFSLAVDRKYKKDGNQQADFINCVAFGKIAEFTQKYLFKGTKIAIEGKIQTGSYTKQDGSKAYTADVIVENCEFAESKNNNNNNNSSTKPPAETPPENNGFYPVEDEDDDLPF